MEYPKLNLFDVVETRDGRRGIILPNPDKLCVYIIGHGCTWFLPGETSDEDGEYLEDLTIGNRWVLLKNSRDYDIMRVWRDINPLSILGCIEHGRDVIESLDLNRSGHCIWSREEE